MGNAMAAVFNSLVIFRGNPYSLNSQNGLTLVCASKGHCLWGVVVKATTETAPESTQGTGGMWMVCDIFRT